MGDKNTNMTKLVIILFLWEGNKSTKNLSSIGQTKRRKLLLLLLQLLCIICMSQLLEHLITKIAAKIEESFQEEDDQGRRNIYL